MAKKLKNSDSDETKNVFIGKRPMMNYVMAIMQAKLNSDVVVVLARGGNINKACNVTEYYLRNHGPEMEYKDIKISTTEYPDEKGNTRKTSEIIIELSVKKQ